MMMMMRFGGAVKFCDCCFFYLIYKFHNDETYVDDIYTCRYICIYLYI